MTLPPLAANAVLDTYFLEARAKLLDVAAILDRIDRGRDPAGVPDERLELLRRALAILRDPDGDRAERVQLLFSLPYDPNWPRPTPR